MAEMQAKMKRMPEAQRQMMKDDGGQDSGMMRKERSSVGARGEENYQRIFMREVAATKGREGPMSPSGPPRTSKGFDVLRKDWEPISSKMMSMVPNGKGLAECIQEVGGVAIQTDYGRNHHTCDEGRTAVDAGIAIRGSGQDIRRSILP